MCITRIINRILLNYFKSEYYNVHNPNFLMCDIDLYIIKLESINILKSSFSKLTNSLRTNNTIRNSDKKQEPKEMNINQQIHIQTLYHNLTYDHGICLLN